MKQDYYYHIQRPAFKRLVKEAYKAINSKLFNNELPSIRLKIARLENSPREIIYGQFAVYETEQGFYVVDYDPISRLAEHPVIKICSEFAYYPADNAHVTTFGLFNTLAHEMTHAYCYLNGINDHIDGTNYHNYNFAEACEQHGLICEYDSDENGFANTHLPWETYLKIMDCVPHEVWDYVKDHTAKK